jgi:flagellar protein FliO/FliZ
MNPGLTPLLWFFGVIALIPLVLWMVKRSPMGSGLVQGPVRQVGVLPLSATQRLVTVEVGQGDDRLWLVLGVTPGSIATLHTMAPGSAVPGLPPHALTAVTPQTTFAQLLQRMQGRGPDAS